MLYSQLGYLITSRLHQLQLKESMRQSLLAEIPDSELEMIPLEANFDKIVWEEKGHEFMLNGKMYDVARSIKKSGQTVLLCISDEKEDDLLARTNAITKSNQQKSSKQHPLVISLIYGGDAFKDEIDFSLALMNVPRSGRHSYFIPSAVISILLPPPKA